jgi:hypothetical protein
MSKSSITIPAKNSATPQSPPSGVAFTTEEASNIIRFLECIRSVVGRLFSEGYTLKDGRLVPPSPSVVFDPTPKATEEK